MSKRIVFTALGPVTTAQTPRAKKPLPGTQMAVTERAYTSPIWYAP